MPRHRYTAQSDSHVTSPNGSQMAPDDGEADWRRRHAKTNQKMDFGIARITKLLKLLANPHINSYSILHVAGTNGKGSITASLDSVISTRQKTGRFNSPHFLHPRDAIRVKQEIIPLSHHEDLMKHVQRVNQDVGCTSFEVMTACALLYFKQCHVDVAIVEVGLGGRLDATNVFVQNYSDGVYQPEQSSKLLCTIIASIGMDHENVLGPTIQDIARAKAGIVKQNVPIIVSPQMHDFDVISAAINQVAKEEDAGPITWVTPATRHDQTASLTLSNFGQVEYQLSLNGEYQLSNTATSLTALDVIAHSTYPFAPPSIHKQDLQNISKTKWPGRLEWIKLKTSHGQNVKLLLDGAHNAQAALELQKYIMSLSPKRVIYIVGMSCTKSIPEILSPLLAAANVVISVPFSTPEDMPWVKCHSPEEVMLECKLIEPGCIAMTASTLGQALDMVAEMVRDSKEESLVVVCGSLYLASDLYRLIGREV
jgi:folylpolyglutamate synthase/dihydrofolate synthase